MNTTVIIPVHNLRRRGYERLINSLYSLALQDIPVKTIVCDSSERSQFDQLNHIIRSKFTKDVGISHFKILIDEFNKPLLLNFGIKEASTKYIMCTDADYIFRKDFIRCLEDSTMPRRMTVKKVLMLPNKEITTDMVRNWGVFPDCSHNEFGELADGGCQFATKAWFVYCGGYDERMSGWCGMDNDMTNRYKGYGGEVYWMDQSEFYHQWHRVEKGSNPQDRAKMQRNWRIRDTDESIIRNR